MGTLRKEDVMGKIFGYALTIALPLIALAVLKAAAPSVHSKIV